jgi:hypothetical protein
MFRILSLVVVWVLFLFGLGAIAGGFVRALSGNELPIVSAYFGFGIASLVLSVIAAKIGQTME